MSAFLCAVVFGYFVKENKSSLSPTIREGRNKESVSKVVLIVDLALRVLSIVS